MVRQQISEKPKCATMISEKEFATGFTGFWAECLPLLNPQVIAEFNLMGTPLAEDRWGLVRPLTSSSDNSNNDVIAETAFGLFAASVKQEMDVLALAQDQALIKGIGDSAIARIVGLSGYWRTKRRFVSTPTDQGVELARRLEEFFASRSEERPITIQPRFKGCGILDSCYGDILASTTLYESKMVDRNMRGADLRQLLIYCSLNYRSRQYAIECVAVLNVRRAIVYEFPIEYLARRASGKTAPELFHQITNFLCDFEAMHQRS
jgi:hypothetical protein